MKKISTKRAKALQIPKKVKEAVYERDGGLCVVCGRRGLPEAHYIPRSKGGLGIEQNVVCLCRDCHNKFDFGDGETVAFMDSMIQMYLREHYIDWSVDDLVYKKYGGIFDEINDTELDD